MVARTFATIGPSDLDALHAASARMVGIMVASLSATSQHAVIVAREYRIPTVLMTRDTTNVISDR